MISVSAVFLLYKYATQNFNFFKRLGVPGPRPYPFIGTMYLAMKHGIAKADRMLIEKYGKVVGVFSGSLPCLLIADSEILKQIMVSLYFSKLINMKLIDFIPISIPFPLLVVT